jgi:hypothetical protein
MPFISHCYYLLPQRASLKRASKAADLIFMYMYYIYADEISIVSAYFLYADEISIVSAYFGLPQCTASGPAGYSWLINRPGIRQTSNVIIFHLWFSFMESHSWRK